MKPLSVVARQTSVSSVKSGVQPTTRVQSVNSMAYSPNSPNFLALQFGRLFRLAKPCLRNGWFRSILVGAAERLTKRGLSFFKRGDFNPRFDDISVCADGSLQGSCISRAHGMQCRCRPEILRSLTDFQYDGSGIVSAGFRDGRFHQTIGGRQI